MNLFILAAGTGSRLLPLTRNTPKSLLDLGNGSSLLEQQIDGAISSKLVDNIFIVTGYRSDQIEAKLEEYRRDINIETIYNPFFDTTNNLVSVWCGLQKMMEHDFIITNGDNLYKEDVLPHLGDLKEGIHLTISRKEHYDEDDMKVILDPRQFLQQVSKDIDPTKAEAESVGLVGVFGLRYRRAFCRKVVNMMRHKENMQKFWLHIFNSLIEDGLSIDTLTIPGEAWAEVDFHPDIDTIRSEVLSHLNSDLKKKQLI